MRILVLGAGGMIGHKMFQFLTSKYPETYGTVRRPFDDYANISFFIRDKILPGLDVSNWAEVEKVLTQVSPDVILNCIGVTLRKPEIKDLNYSLELNSFLPHRLKCWSAQKNVKVVHFSTDCVFNGKAGAYDELSLPTAEDTYGRTKYLGEVVGPTCLTLRSSMIGREIYGKSELLEWALAQHGKTIQGYSRAIYSGITTEVMAELVGRILQSSQFLSGLYQVSSSPISKYELLKKINSAFKLEMKIEEDCSYVSKKDLDSSKIRREMGFVCPSWDEMINQLASDKQ
jgi:dTDP-4-dehydrorhamnose reductase